MLIYSDSQRTPHINNYVETNNFSSDTASGKATPLKLNKININFLKSLGLKIRK